jgi:transcriptional regulator with XRE-family HTH domain
LQATWHGVQPLQQFDREIQNVVSLSFAYRMPASAERMGGDRAYVSGLEQGQRNPTVLTLWHITKALGVRLQAFFDEDKPRRRPAGKS